MRIVGEIPARIGSKRVKEKNLRDLNGLPLISYSIRAALGARSLNDVYVNTDSDRIEETAKRYGVRTYRRPDALGSDLATQDEFNFDFLVAVKPDVLVMVNPASPLVEAGDIDLMVDYFLDQELDTLVTVRDEYVHAYVGGKPANFEMNGRLERTQDLLPIRACTWSMGIWRASAFLDQYRRKGHAAFCGRVGFYPLNRIKSLKISSESDFLLAQILLAKEELWKSRAVPYDNGSLGPDAPSMWADEIRHIISVLDEQSRRAHLLNVLEWGSGQSTVFFSSYLKQKGLDFRWLAIENYVPWHSRVCRRIADHHLEATTQCVLASPTWEDRKDVQEELGLEDYVHHPARLGGQFDVILVDGRRRRECLEVASQVLRPNGVVLLHDAEREPYHASFALFRNRGKFVVEHPSPVPGGVQKLWEGRASG